MVYKVWSEVQRPVKNIDELAFTYPQRRTGPTQHREQSGAVMHMSVSECVKAKGRYFENKLSQ